MSQATMDQSGLTKPMSHLGGQEAQHLEVKMMSSLLGLDLARAWNLVLARRTEEEEVTEAEVAGEEDREGEEERGSRNQF